MTAALDRQRPPDLSGVSCDSRRGVLTVYVTQIS